ncbi:PTS transporter subunit EIIB [Actinomyces timonensis]|uniref:PTS transporter subunit EIIB n=1 Tax=Actinomyces timonensis TaxID=1288391 RepID=A0AAU8MZU0_9ACTO
MSPRPLDMDALLSALGGAENIDALEPCTTRVRIEVRDPRVVDRDAVRAVGAHGATAAGRVVQVVVGPSADDLAAGIAARLWPDNTGATHDAG